jgi:hypothetical protein
LIFGHASLASRLSNLTEKRFFDNEIESDKEAALCRIPGMDVTVVVALDTLR